jgi:hypothetical protein
MKDRMDLDWQRIILQAMPNITGHIKEFPHILTGQRSGTRCSGCSL